MITVLVTLVGAYLLGSINFAVIFTKIFMDRDVRNYGSGNAGATNALRVGGILPGILTFVCDVLKAVVACAAGRYVFDYLLQNGLNWALPIYGAYLCGLACMLGHVFPIFFGLKGGKGVAVGWGAFLVIAPAAAGIGLAAFLVIWLLTRIVSVGSILSTVVVMIMGIVFRDEAADLFPQILMSVLMGGLVIARHTANIQRLLNGEEKKTVFGGKSQ